MLLLRKKKNSGFLLLEVILSVLIIAGGLVFIIRSYSTSLKAAEVAKAMTRACLLLENKIFELDIIGEIKEGQDSGAVEGEENYNWYLTASPLDSDEKEPKLNRVDLSMACKSGTQSRKVSVSTYLRNKES